MSMADHDLAPEREASQTSRPDDIKAVPVRHPGRWLAAMVVLLVAASMIRAVVTNRHFEWHVVSRYLLATPVLHGVLATLYMTALSMVIGILFGVSAAVMRLSPNPIVSGASWLYIWFFRATPLLVQILFWYNIAALFPAISIGVPFGPSVIHANANTVITTFGAGILALSLNEGAYMAEIVRAGMVSVPAGQTEAAVSLGLSRLQTVRRIVLPQAMRVIIPPTGNETISMLKNTSLLSVIAFVELLYSVQQIYNVNYETIPLLIVASIWYLVITSVLYIGQYFIERRFGHGFAGARHPTMRERWVAARGGPR